MNELTVVNDVQGCLSAQAVRSQVNLIQHVMQEVMRKGEHYGVIPGCGDKPTLLKPGAEKLCLTFRLDMQPDIEIVELGNGHREYRTKVQVFHIDSGKRIGSGVGSASTMESKYRWRGGARLCPHCGKATIKRSKFPPKSAPKAPPGFYCYSKIGGCGTEFAHDDASIVDQSEERQENPDIADTWNTVLKISKKRAMVDAALSTTAASDIFTQDIEDFHGDGEPVVEVTVDKPPESKKAVAPADMQWLDVYERDVNAAPDEESLRLAEFAARGHFDRMSDADKAKHKERLLRIRAAKDEKRKSFLEPVNTPEQIAERRAVIDKLVGEYGQEKFLEAAQAAGLRGDSDTWPIEKLNAVAEQMKSEPPW